MNSSWRIGTAFGTGIYIHWTFAILPAVALINGWSAGGRGQALFMLCMLIAACTCVVLHELGHALMARHFGINTRDITLYPIGGVARLERLSTRPVEEILIAIAGPAVNVAIAGILGAGWVAAVSALGLDATLSRFLSYIGLINVALVLFNMLPAFPMDGGRVLRATVALFVDYVRATEIAFYLGVVMAGLFATASVASLLYGGGSGPVPLPTLALIAGFIVFAGRQELNMVRRRETRRNAEPIDVLPADPEPLLPAGSVGPGFSGYTWDNRIQALVKWRDGQPVATYPMPLE